MSAGTGIVDLTTVNSTVAALLRGLPTRSDGLSEHSDRVLEVDQEQNIHGRQ